jgi:hypothetical protein
MRIHDHRYKDQPWVWWLEIAGKEPDGRVTALKPGRRAAAKEALAKYRSDPMRPPGWRLWVCPPAEGEKPVEITPKRPYTFRQHEKRKALFKKLRRLRQSLEVAQRDQQHSKTRNVQWMELAAGAMTKTQADLDVIDRQLKAMIPGVDDPEATQVDLIPPSAVPEGRPAT